MSKIVLIFALAMVGLPGMAGTFRAIPLKDYGIANLRDVFKMPATSRNYEDLIDQSLETPDAAANVKPRPGTETNPLCRDFDFQKPAPAHGDNWDRLSVAKRTTMEKILAGIKKFKQEGLVVVDQNLLYKDPNPNSVQEDFSDDKCPAKSRSGLCFRPCETSSKCRGQVMTLKDFQAVYGNGSDVEEGQNACPVIFKGPHQKHGGVCAAVDCNYFHLLQYLSQHYRYDSASQTWQSGSGAVTAGSNQPPSGKAF